MNQEQLIDQYLRLKRKLSTSYGTWHSGRIDRLAGALQCVERELRARQPEVASRFGLATARGVYASNA
jgi:hypothetical protein